MTTPVRYTGKVLMIVAAFCTATGQLFWKWGVHQFLYYGVGFLFYGLGAWLMIRALSREKLSVAYPLMSSSYLFALIYGAMLLHETVTLQKGIAVLLLMVGVAFISYGK